MQYLLQSLVNKKFQLPVNVDVDQGLLYITKVDLQNFAKKNKVKLNLSNATPNKCSITDIQNINPVLTQWIVYGLTPVLQGLSKCMINSNDKGLVITVYDAQFWQQNKLNTASNTSSTPIEHWHDQTNNWINHLPLDFVSFDTETTGLDVHNDRIIQISAAKYRKGKLVDTYDTLVNPRKQILPKITAITGITTQQVLNAKDFVDVVPDFIKFIQGENLVGQNIIKFDLPLIEQEIKRAKLDWGTYDVIDTLPLTKIAFPNRRHYSQGSLDKDLQLSKKIEAKGYVDHNVLHNSLNDSLTTAELYLQDIHALRVEHEGTSK